MLLLPQCGPYDFLITPTLPSPIPFPVTVSSWSGSPHPQPPTLLADYSSTHCVEGRLQPHLPHHACAKPPPLPLDFPWSGHSIRTGSETFPHTIPRRGWLLVDPPRCLRTLRCYLCAQLQPDTFPGQVEDSACQPTPPPHPGVPDRTHCLLIPHAPLCPGSCGPGFPQPHPTGLPHCPLPACLPSQTTLFT